MAIIREIKSFHIKVEIVKKLRQLIHMINLKKVCLGYLYNLDISSCALGS